MLLSTCQGLSAAVPIACAVPFLGCTITGGKRLMIRALASVSASKQTSASLDVLRCEVSASSAGGSGCFC